MARSISSTTGVFATVKTCFQSAGVVIETSALAMAASSEALVSLAETAKLHADDLYLQTQADLFVERKLKDLELAKELALALKATTDANADAEIASALALIEKHRSK